MEPRVVTGLPGPRTRALLERKDRVLNGPLRDTSACRSSRANGATG